MFNHDLCNLHLVARLRKHLMHSKSQAVPNEHIFYMPRHCNNLRVVLLGNPEEFKSVNNLLEEFEAVHFRHFDVCEDEPYSSVMNSSVPSINIVLE